MSSKSRKKKKRKPKAKPKPKPKAGAGTGTGAGTGAGTGTGTGKAVAEGHGKGLEIPDEYITAPKRASKWRFVLMIALVVVLLIIFIVPEAMMGMFGGGGGGDSVYFVWEHPTQGTQEYRYGEFKREQRAFTFALDVDRLLLFQLQLTDERPTEEDVARLLVLDRLATDAGVRVTDRDLAEHLGRTIDIVFQGNREVYKQVAARDGSIAVVEDTVRRCMRVERFLELAGFAAAVADPEEIESLWAEDHVELAFDYVALATADFEDAARAELPEDAELARWFEGLPELERDALRTPERRRARFVRFRDVESTPAAALVTAFPEAEDADAEERAQTYYNRVFFKRFVRADGEGDEGDEGDPKSDFYSMDEVRERCLAEAPVYFAMTRWLADLRARQEAGEAIDLAAEAALYGLETVEMEAPLSREELREHEQHGDDALVAAVFQADPDAFAATVVVSATDLSIVRGVERVEPALPPFAEIREQVAELWVEPRARELAEERLRELRDGFEEFVPEEEADEDAFPPPPPGTRRRATEEAFAAAAAGLEVRRRDWLDKAGDAEADPDHEDPAHRFLWRQRQLHSLAQDEVAEPALDQAQGTVYLVRLAGKREVPIERMTPGQYQQYKTRARAVARRDVSRGFDLEFLRERYGLAFARSAEEELDPAEEPTE